MFCQVGSNVGMSLESKLPADDSGITKVKNQLILFLNAAEKVKWMWNKNYLIIEFNFL